MTTTLTVTEPVSDLTVTVSPAEPSSGWYPESPAVTATSSVALIEVSVDGGPWEEYAVLISTVGDGVHTVALRDSLGGDETVAFSVDGTSPAVVASVDPVVGPSGWWTSAVTVRFSVWRRHVGCCELPRPGRGGHRRSRTRS